MNPEPDALTLIRTTFADQHALVERAYRQSRSFRDLCQDYRRCLVALQRWDQRRETGVATRRQEYSDLLAELAEEIRASLDVLDVPDEREDDACRVLDQDRQDDKRRIEEA